MLNRIAATAAWLGVLLAIVGLVIFEARPEWSAYVTAVEFLALAFLIFFFVVHFEAVKDFSTRRSTKLGMNSALMVVIFVAILGILNFLANQHDVQWDLSETESFTLAPQTIELLENLKNDIKITAFSQDQSRTRDAIKDLLNSYTHLTRRISYQFVDPDRKPTIAKQYGITQYDTLVIESNKQETQIKSVNEQELTNALIRVTRDGKRKIRFLEGHGERAIDDAERAGLLTATAALEKQGYELLKLSLLQEGRVPEGTAALIIAGPERGFLPQEIEAISVYLSQGGRVLLMIDPDSRAGLDGFLSQWGLTLGSGIVIDTLSRLFGGDLTTPIVSNYPPHEITRGFNLATFFAVARSIEFEGSRSQDLTFQVIAQTGENSWSKANLSEGQVKFEPGIDRPGPLNLAVAVTPKEDPTAQALAEEGLGAPPNPMRDAALVVFGDADFASNAYINFSGNLDIFLNTLSWLTREKDLISIRPRETRFAPLFLTGTQGRVILYTSLVVAPGAVFIAGLFIWQRRRRL